MKLLSESIADDADFFVEQIHIVAIVFDNTDDVTVWATTFFDNDAHFFHLALPFKALDTLLALAHTRAEALQEEVADALADAEQSAQQVRNPKRNIECVDRSASPEHRGDDDLPRQSRNA